MKATSDPIFENRIPFTNHKIFDRLVYFPLDRVCFMFWFTRVDVFSIFPPGYCAPFSISAAFQTDIITLSKIFRSRRIELFSELFSFRVFIMTVYCFPKPVRYYDKNFMMDTVHTSLYESCRLKQFTVVRLYTKYVFQIN